MDTNNINKGISWFRWMVSPLSVLVWLITQCRHFLFDKGILKARSLPIFTLVVGNLRLGGTGKTPVVMYLSSLFAQYDGAILLRGYRRKTSGFIAVDATCGMDEVGDEALLHYANKPTNFTVYVGENRFEAGKKIIANRKNTELILLDDGFQHRAFKPTVSLVLTAYHAPFFQDYPVPLGNLRESRYNMRRASALLVTQCPEEMTQEEKESFEQTCRRYLSKEAPVFFSSIRYQAPYHLHKKNEISLAFKSRVVLVAGLANPDTFVRDARSCFDVHAFFPFPDHYIYTEEQVKRIQKIFPNTPLLITEKDAVKWERLSLGEHLPIFVWPISVRIHDEKEFLAYILDKYHNFKG